MKNLSFTKQSYTNARAFPFTQLRAKFEKERFNIDPFDIATYWSGKYQR